MKRKIRSKKAEKCLHKERVILVMLLSAVLLFFLASSPNFGTKTIVDSVDYFNQVSLFDGSSITGAAVIGISSTDNDDDLGTFVDDFADGISNTSRWFNHTTRMTIHHENELMRFNASLASTEGNASIITIENLSMHSFNITANVTLQNTSDSLSTDALATIELSLFNQTNLSQTTTCSVNLEESSGGAYYLYFGNSTTSNPPPTIINAEMANIGDNLTGLLRMEYINDTETINCTFTTGFDSYSVKGVTKDIGQDFGAGILSQLTTQGGAASGDVNATIASFNYSLAPVASANNEPTSTILLNTTDLTANDTNQNLTAYSETSDLDNDDVFVVYNWLLNGSSVMVLNMPFLPNDNNESASTHNYALGDNGNNTGGASWNSTGGFDFNGSYEFDSIDDYLSLENSGQYEPTMNFSIEAWVYVKGSGNNGGQNGIVNKDGGFNDGFNFAIGDSSAPTVNFGTGDSGASDIETITELNLNEWTHVVASYNGSNTSIYINGALDFVGTRTGALAYSTGDLEIGRNRDTPPGQEGYFNGSIDNVRIWNITLTPEQISALYKNRTDLIVSQELSVGDNWTVDVTPNDGVLDGAINRSNDLLVLDVTAPAANNDPTSTILLNTTDLTKNDTNQNLTAYVDTSDLDADTVNVVYNWLLNGSSVMVLNMPFLPNDGNETASTHNYALGDNGNVTGATWNSTGGFDFNGSYEFDSVDDYISIRDRSEFELTSNITIEAWFYLKGNGSTGISGLLNKDGGFGNGFDIELGTDDLLNVAFNTGDFGSTTLETAANAISLNRWTHLVIMYNGSNTSIYIDGALNVVGTKTGALTYSTGDLEIGRAINSSGQEGYFNGSIDNVRIWNRTLTPEQISALYKNRTDLIVSQELNVGDNWTVDVTPNDGVLDGAINRSNDLLVLDIVAAAPSCGTLTSNTTLTEDINSTETCFTIGAHGITLDCDNYLINYSTEGSGNGIDNTGYHNVTIKDCRIEQYGNTGEAILWDDARSGKLINNTIITYTATSPAIFIPPNSNNTYITKNNLTTKDNSYALDVVGRDNNITNNTFLSTNSAGIRVVYAQGVKNLFKNNFIQGYPFGSIGIDVNNLNNTFLNNTIIMNSSSSWGVRITDGNYTHLENNTINVTGATSYGIYLSDSSERNSLINNLLETNSSDSFSIFDETDDNKINYMSYINASSKIEWVDNGSRSFLRNLTFNGTIGPNTNIYLGNGTVAVDTSAFDNGKINSTVNITFYGLDLEFADAVIKIHSFSTDGVTIDSSGSDCVGDSCEIISYTGGTLRFNSTSLGSLFANNSEDLTPPNVTILTPINTSNFSKTSSNQTFNVSINEANIYGVLFIFDNGSGVDFNITANNNSGYWAAPYNVSTLAEGTQTVRVSANDTAGNINSTQQVTITTDYTAPNVTIISPTNRSNYSFTSSNQTFNTSVFDANIKTVWFSFDNGTGTDFNITANNNSGYWAAPYNVSTLAEGTQTITIIANDSAGNVNTTQSITITTDYTVPVVNITFPTNGTNFSIGSYNQTFNVSIQERDIGTVLFNFDNSSGTGFNLTPTNQSGYWVASYNVSKLANGTHLLTILVNDTVNNKNNTQTINFTFDNRTMPVAPAPAGAGNTGSSGGGGSSSSSDSGGGGSLPIKEPAPKSVAPEDFEKSEKDVVEEKVEKEDSSEQVDSKGVAATTIKALKSAKSTFSATGKAFFSGEFLLDMSGVWILLISLMLLSVLLLFVTFRHKKRFIPYYVSDYPSPELQVERTSHLRQLRSQVRNAGAGVKREISSLLAKGRIHQTSLKWLQNWVETMQGKGDSEAKIKSLLQHNPNVTPQMIKVVLDRIKAKKLLQKKYSLSLKELEKIEKVVLKLVKKGKTISEIKSIFSENGWDSSILGPFIEAYSKLVRKRKFVAYGALQISQKLARKMVKKTHNLSSIEIKQLESFIDDCYNRNIPMGEVVDGLVESGWTYKEIDSLVRIRYRMGLYNVVL